MKLRRKADQLYESRTRVLRRMPVNMAILIPYRIEAYAHDPASQASTVRSLKEREGTRLRLGDWRVILDDLGNVLAMLDIGARVAFMAQGV